MKSNFYIKCLIRVLKEYNVYENVKPRLYDVIYNKILTYDYVSTPHTIVNDVIEYLNRTIQKEIKDLYIKLIKSYYIDNIKTLIDDYYKEKGISIYKRVDAEIIWKRIEENYLLRHLEISYKIKRSYIKKNKFKIFYKELYDKRPINDDILTHI